MYLRTPADLPALARLCAAALRDSVDSKAL
jgi:hypothetical protein